MAEGTVVYLASPYSHPDHEVREERFRAACRASAAMVRRGVLVYSPIAHSHPLVTEGGGLPAGWDFWEGYDRAMLSRCDELAVLAIDGWKESRGLKFETALALEMRIPVYRVDERGVVLEEGQAVGCLTKAEDRWDRRYASLARYVSMWSKDSTKNGAVLVGSDPGKVALGYNGFPRGVEDTEERLGDRPTKLKLVMHAERNVLDNAEFCARGSTLYCTQAPCSECAKSVVGRGVSRVVCPPYPAKEPWAEDSRWAKLILREGGVRVDYLSREGGY